MTSWQEVQEDGQKNKWQHSEITTERVVRWFTLAMQEMGIIEKLDITADVAKKAFDISERIDRRMKQRTLADVRATAAHLATLKANTQDAEEG